MISYNARLQRRCAATIGEALCGIIHGPYLEPLAELFVAAGVGRRRLHTGWVPAVADGWQHCTVCTNEAIPAV